MKKIQNTHIKLALEGTPIEEILEMFMMEIKRPIGWIHRRNLITYMNKNFEETDGEEILKILKDVSDGKCSCGETFTDGKGYMLSTLNEKEKKHREAVEHNFFFERPRIETKKRKPRTKKEPVVVENKTFFSNFFSAKIYGIIWKRLFGH